MLWGFYRSENGRAPENPLTGARLGLPLVRGKVLVQLLGGDAHEEFRGRERCSG